ncbi:MAG: cysteine desulfurase [Clostridia bacterium]|nr:cysteine desulfurase [Clostridia bacterium]MBQ4086043.1 cysteine desulfurase [Clostridia bacterium]
MAGVMSAYLDNSATTRPSENVIEAMAQCMRDGFYNPSSQYAPAVESEKNMAACRAEIARSLKVSPDEITFTSGGTEANNLAILGVAKMQRGPGHFIVNATEHPSVLSAFEEAEKMGHKVTVLPVLADGTPDMDAYREALAEKPVLVSIMQVNNETGTMANIKKMADMAKKANPKCLFHVDGVQGFLRVPFDARIVDLYTLSGHKIHGPKGTGALYVKKGVRLAPRQVGGGQEKGLRSGTENTPGIAGLYKAVQEMKAMHGLREELMLKKLRFLALVRQAVPEALVNGPQPENSAPHIINLSFPNVRGEVMLHALEAKQVYCSTGSACSSKKRHVSAVLTAMGLSADRAEGALRFSFSPYTTDEEIEYAAACIGESYALLKQYQRR